VCKSKICGKEGRINIVDLEIDFENIKKPMETIPN
jgi:hypothetical protein